MSLRIFKRSQVLQRQLWRVPNFEPVVLLADEYLYFTCHLQNQDIADALIQLEPVCFDFLLMKEVLIGRLKVCIFNEYVSIDAITGPFHDIASRYPIIICEECMTRRGGDAAKNLQVAEVLEMLLLSKKHKERSGEKRRRYSSLEIVAKGLLLWSD